MARWGTGVDVARELGVSRQAISKAEKSGRLSRAANGMFDIDAAKIQYKLHTDPEQQLRSLQQKQSGEIAVVDRGLGLSEGGDAAALIAAKARRESAEAELAELELAEKRGQIMSVADHRRIIFVMARAMRDALLQIPSRSASILAAEGDATACRRIVEAEIRTAMRQLEKMEMPPEDAVTG